MQNKTLAFVGDSLGRQQFQSLMCMITGGKDKLEVEDVGREYGLVIAEGAKATNLQGQRGFGLKGKEGSASSGSGSVHETLNQLMKKKINL